VQPGSSKSSHAGRGDPEWARRSHTQPSAASRRPLRYSARFTVTNCSASTCNCAVRRSADWSPAAHVELWWWAGTQFERINARSRCMNMPHGSSFGRCAHCGEQVVWQNEASQGRVCYDYILKARQGTHHCNRLCAASHNGDWQCPYWLARQAIPAAVSASHCDAGFCSRVETRAYPYRASKPAAAWRAGRISMRGFSLLAAIRRPPGSDGCSRLCQPV
jgi:hypothetical protein